MSSYIEGPRFSPITPDDQAGAIWVATLLLCVYTALAWMARLFIKWSALDNDDHTLTAGTIFHAVAVIALSVALRNGLGKKTDLIPEDDFNTMNRSVYVSQIFFIFGLALSKASAVFLFVRLFARNMKWMFVACWGTIGLIAVWTITSIIALTAGCSQYATIEPAPGSDATCPNIKSRWAYIMAIDVVIEVILLVLPCVLIIPLQMPYSRRIPLLLAFAFRIPVIAFAAVHLKLVYSWAGSENPAYTVSTAIIWAHVELCWSLLSASIPNFKTFMRSLSMGFGIDIGVLTTMNGTRDNAIESHPFRSHHTVNDDPEALGTRAAAEAEKKPMPEGRVSTVQTGGEPVVAGDEPMMTRQVEIHWNVEEKANN